MTTLGVTNDTALLRRLNTRATLPVLRQGGPQTLTQLARAAGLSRQTAEVALSDLTERRLAEECSPTGGWEDLSAVLAEAGRDAELVVVGGGFSRAGESLLMRVRAHLAETCLNPPEVTLSTFGEESIALGAVRMALDHVERERLGL
ncbi:hypothetical protein ACIA8R_49910 [Nonomuraea sp. NPDC051191]|uniref:hypothetical protein n=1 Tax=Nonomuraea sp. NPDC051191 TaxID=3364372 RepID=UPI0037A440B1